MSETQNQSKVHLQTECIAIKVNGTAARVAVYVCVCVREREGRGEGAQLSAANFKSKMFIENSLHKSNRNLPTFDIVPKAKHKQGGRQLKGGVAALS